jgi:predicted esterase
MMIKYLIAFFAFSPALLCAQVKVMNYDYGYVEGYSLSIPYEHKDNLSDAAKEIMIEAYTNTPKEIIASLTVYQPDHQKSDKLVVLLHDGGFLLGERNDYFSTQLANHLASSGFLTVTLDYPLGYKYGKSFAIEAVHKVVQSVHQAINYLYHENVVNFNPQNVIVGGASAGGIAALTTLFLDDGEFEPYIRDAYGGRAELECLSCNVDGRPVEVQFTAAFSLWGGLLDLSIIDEDELKLPVYLIHGTADETVPYDSGFPFQQYGQQHKMTARHLFPTIYGSGYLHDLRILNSKLIYVDNGGHTLYLASNNDVNSSKVDDFCKKISTFVSTLH